MIDKKNNTKIITIVYLLLIFMVGVVFHYLYGTFSKSIDVMPDEIRYYSIARSLFQGDGLAFRGEPTDYQKLGYALYLMPFFVIKNGILRIKAITLANSVVMMSSVFPLYGIMNRINLNKRLKMILAACFIVFPDLMYSATFMAEIMYWPILLLFIYLWVLNNSKNKYAISIILGVIAYVGYITKEIFLAVVLSVVLFEIVYPVIEFFLAKKSRKLRFFYDRKRIINAVIIVTMFLVLFIVVKLLFFRGMGNSYDQMGIEAIMSFKGIGYLLYGFFYYIVAFMVACFIIPVLIPAFEYKNLDKNIKRLYIYNVIAVTMSIATIAYTITVREDFLEIVPRLHFRYIGPYVVLAIIVFFACVNSSEKKFEFKKTKVLTFIFVCVITFAIFRGVIVKTGIDQFVLNWVYSITSRVNGLWGIIIVDVVVLAISSLIMVFVYGNKKQMLNIIVILLVLAFGIIDTITAKNRLLEYMYRDEDLVNETIRLNDALSSVDGGILYIADYSSYDDCCTCIDSFVDKSNGLYYIDYHSIEGMKEGVYNVENLQLPMQFNLWKMVYSDIESIEYVIENNNDESLKLKVDNLTRIDDLSNAYYTVYKNNDSKQLHLKTVTE